MDPELDIFQVARDYVAGELTLDALQEWLVPRLGSFLEDLSSSSSELAALVELTLADITSGEASEEELRTLVTEFLREHESIRLGSPTKTASANETVTTGPFFAGSPPSTEFNQFELSPAGI